MRCIHLDDFISTELIELLCTMLCYILVLDWGLYCLYAKRNLFCQWDSTKNEIESLVNVLMASN